MRYARSVLDTIGETPLVQLTKVTEGVRATVLAKVEYLNPGGSVKDRIAQAMIDDAEHRGVLRPGGTIVEPTSGNTGVGLALVAQQRGYRCVFVCPDKVAEDKLATLRAYGAEVVVTPTAVAPDSEESYYGVANRLTAEIEGAFQPNQFFNPAAPAAHEATTGPEIWRDTDGRVTHFVAGVGTGGTITGTARHLKRASEGAVTVIGADPEGSIYSGGTGRPYLVEGVGEDMWPGNYDPSVVDRVIAIDDAESFAMTRRLAREEGLLVGGSSGMAVAAALRVARDVPEEAIVVVLLPDSGRGYLQKLYSDPWMRSYGFAADGAAAGGQSHGPVARDLLRAAGRTPEFPHVHPSETVAAAVRTMREGGARQLPVLSAEPPVVIGEVVGAVHEHLLLAALADGSARGTDPVSEHLGPKLPHVGAATPLAELQRALDEEDTVLVVENAKPIGLLSRSDLLDHLVKETA